MAAAVKVVYVDSNDAIEVIIASKNWKRTRAWAHWCDFFVPHIPFYNGRNLLASQVINIILPKIIINLVNF